MGHISRLPTLTDQFKYRSFQLPLSSALNFLQTVTIFTQFFFLLKGNIVRGHDVISLICDNSVTKTVSQQQCHNSKSLIFWRNVPMF